MPTNNLESEGVSAFGQIDCLFVVGKDTSVAGIGQRDAAKFVAINEDGQPNITAGSGTTYDQGVVTGSGNLDIIAEVFAIVPPASADAFFIAGTVTQVDIIVAIGGVAIVAGALVPIIVIVFHLKFPWHSDTIIATTIVTILHHKLFYSFCITIR